MLSNAWAEMIFLRCIENAASRIRGAAFFCLVSETQLGLLCDPVNERGVILADEIQECAVVFEPRLIIGT